MSPDPRRGHGLAGAIRFYGRPGSILGLMGGADEGIPVAEVRAFEQALEEAGAEHELVVHDGAPHSFFDRAQEQFADASADARNRVLGLVEQRSS